MRPARRRTSATAIAHAAIGARGGDAHATAPPSRRPRHGAPRHRDSRASPRRRPRAARPRAGTPPARAPAATAATAAPAAQRAAPAPARQPARAAPVAAPTAVSAASHGGVGQRADAGHASSASTTASVPGRHPRRRAGECPASARAQRDAGARPSVIAASGPDAITVLPNGRFDPRSTTDSTASAADSAGVHRRRRHRRCRPRSAPRPPPPRQRCQPRTDGQDRKQRGVGVADPHHLEAGARRAAPTGCRWCSAALRC